MKNQIISTSDTAKSTVEYITDSGIRVKIKYPENVSEVIQQEKINHIYDILTKHKSE